MGKLAETTFSKSKKWTPAVFPEQESTEKASSEPEQIKENNQEFRQNTRFKLIKSTVLITTWTCMGLYSGITGPTVPDFAERLDTDYDSVGFAIAFRSIGKMLGSLTCGYLRDRFCSRGDLIVAVALTLVSASVVVKPWALTITILAVLYFFEGLGHGGINSVGNSMCVLMWNEKAALPVHLLHFGYGVGALLAPLIVSPFLSQHVTQNVTMTSDNTSLLYTRLEMPFNRTVDFIEANSSTYSLNFTSILNSSETIISTLMSNVSLLNSTTNETIGENTSITKVSEIEIPYALVAGIVCAMGLIHLILFAYKPSRKLTTLFGSTSYTSPCDAPFLKGGPKSAIAIIFLFFMYYMMTTAIDRGLGSFLFTYAVESGIGFTKSEAAYLNTAYFGCYAAGRAIMGLVALKVPVKFVIFTEIYLMTLFSAVITFYAYNKRIYLWVFSCALGFFFGPIYPSGVAWVDRYVALYGLVVAIFDVGNGIGAFTANWMSGYLISNLGPRSLLYFTFICAIVLCLLMIVAQSIGSRRGDRHKKLQDTVGKTEKVVQL